MVPASREVEPQRMNVAIGRAKQIVLLYEACRVVYEGIAERVSHGRRCARLEQSAVLVVPASREVEPQRMDVAIGRAKQIVLFEQPG